MDVDEPLGKKENSLFMASKYESHDQSWDEYNCDIILYMKNKNLKIFAYYMYWYYGLKNNFTIHYLNSIFNASVGIKEDWFSWESFFVVKYHKWEHSVWDAD